MRLSCWRCVQLAGSKCTSFRHQDAIARCNLPLFPMLHSILVLLSNYFPPRADLWNGLCSMARGSAGRAVYALKAGKQGKRFAQL